MTALQQQPHSLLDLEQPHSHTRRTGPVAFSDDELLQHQLERRSAERRQERRDGIAAAAGLELDARELCHDLRQPLSSAVVLTHMLGKEADLTAAGRQRLELLHAELARLSGMLSSQLEAAAPVLVDLAAVVRGVCDAPVDATAAPLQLLVDEAPLVLGDPVQLARLVANLVANARGAAGSAGAVRVHVGSVDGAARIAVEDSGDAAGDAASSGYGLGLLIVDSVVRRHGGASSCSPSSLGGLQVAVTIPAALPGQHAGRRA